MSARMNGHAINGHRMNGDHEKSAAAEILEYERAVNKALNSFRDRSHFEEAETKTPLTDLLESEDGSLEEWGIRAETVRRLLIYFAQNGPDPRNIMRAVYAVGAHMGISPYCELTFRERGLMLGDSHGAEHWRTKKLAVDPVRRSGALAYKSPGGKGSEAGAVAAAAQKGNQNRKKKGPGVKKKLSRS